jgi:transposase
MINYETYCNIKLLHETKQLRVGQIAQALHLDRKTVSHWLRASSYEQKAAPVPAQKIEPYKSTLIRLLDQHDYSAQQLYQLIRTEGFDGSYPTVVRYVRRIRPVRKPVYLRLEFAPGECAQLDWGESGSVRIGNIRRKLYFFVMVLCWSRKMYLEFSLRQTMEHFLSCHQNALLYFGGVPRKIMVDNMKTAVLRRLVGQEAIINPRYADFARHYGFTIAPCGVRKGNEKGRVENAVGYIKKNLLNGLSYTHFSDISIAGKQWLEEIANVRVHGTTRQSPNAMFESDRLALQPLPLHDYDPSVIRAVKASSQHRVTLDTNRYTVPAEYAHRELTLKCYPDHLMIYHENQVIARHERCYDQHQDIVNPDHVRELLQQRKKAKDQDIYRRFLRLSPQAERYYQGIQQRRFDAANHLRLIVALSERYPAEQIADAIDSALELHAFSSEYIVNLLEQRQRLLPEAGPLHLTRPGDFLELELEQPNLNIYG